MDLAYKGNSWHKSIWRRFSHGHPKVKQIIKDAERSTKEYDSFMCEVFSRLYSYGSPRKLANVQPEHEWANILHMRLDELPEFEQLRRGCTGDIFSAALATMELTALAHEPLPDNMDPDVGTGQLKDYIVELEALLAKDPNNQKAKDDLAKAKDALQSVADKAAKDIADMPDSLIRNNMRKGISSATAAVRGANAVQGVLSGKADDTTFEEKMEISRKLENSKLRNIAEQAGRLKNIMSEAQRTKATYERTEIADISKGDDLNLLLPAELVMLNVPELEGLFYSKLADKSLMQYELKGKEPMGKGPFVVCIDVSTSMTKFREFWAKAVGLAIMTLAVKQKRYFKVITFNEGIVDEYEHDVHKKNNLDGLYKLVQAAASGATAFQPPLSKAVDYIKNNNEYKKADIVFITDGECSTDKSFIEKFNLAKKELDFKLLVVQISNNENAAPALAEFKQDIHYTLRDIAGQGSDTAKELFKQI